MAIPGGGALGFAKNENGGLAERNSDSLKMGLPWKAMLTRSEIPALDVRVQGLLIQPQLLPLFSASLVLALPLLQ